MGLARRLYRGETNIDFIGSRKRWYIASGLLLTVCILSMVFRGFNWGIEFSGGTQFLIPKQPGVSLQEVERTVTDNGVQVQTGQEAGSGSQAKYVIKTAALPVPKVAAIKQDMAKQLNISPADITDNAVSSSWGGQVTDKALLALAVFLVVVSIYLWIRFEPKMTIAAIMALIHDLVLTAGVYSIVGFEVTPSTVIGLLTILGFSLYDTVVVFDKVSENTKGLLGGTRMTYGEAANLAVNQTLMRSINTSLISLLPVGGLLFVGAGLLGVGTLKDLALVLFVGLLTGAYSSLFLATPWLVDLKEREPRYAALKQRVMARRAGATGAAGKSGGKAAAKVKTSRKVEEPDDEFDEDEDLVDDLDEVDADDEADEPADEPAKVSHPRSSAGRAAAKSGAAAEKDPEVAAAGAPRRTSSSGSRPAQRRRTGGGGKPGRPSGSKRRR